MSANCMVVHSSRAAPLLAIAVRAFHTLNDFLAWSRSKIQITVSQQTNKSIPRHQKNTVTNKRERTNPSKFSNYVISDLTHCSLNKSVSLFLVICLYL